MGMIRGMRAIRTRELVVTFSDFLLRDFFLPAPYYIFSIFLDSLLYTENSFAMYPVFKEIEVFDIFSSIVKNKVFLINATCLVVLI